MSAYYLSEIILKIILNEKKWFFYKQEIIGYTHLNQDKNKNKLHPKYLNYRLEQEFNFYLLKLDQLLYESEFLNKEKIIRNAFFKNTLSWLLLLKKKENHLNFSKKIFKLCKNFKNYKFIKFILLCSIFTPNFVINLMKKTKNIKNLLRSY